MKFSMKKDSPFRNNIFPWLIYGFGTGFYIILLIVKMIKRPELISPWITILLAAAGIALGAVYMMYLKKKVTNRRPYLSLKQGMIIVWVVGLFCFIVFHQIRQVIFDLNEYRNINKEVTDTHS